MSWKNWNNFSKYFQRDDQYILTACQDRNIRVYNVESGKHSKTFKGSQSEDGTLIKVQSLNDTIAIDIRCIIQNDLAFSK